VTEMAYNVSIGP